VPSPRRPEMEFLNRLVAPLPVKSSIGADETWAWPGCSGSGGNPPGLCEYPGRTCAIEVFPRFGGGTRQRLDIATPTLMETRHQSRLHLRALLLVEPVRIMTIANVSVLQCVLNCFHNLSLYKNIYMYWLSLRLMKTFV